MSRRERDAKERKPRYFDAITHGAKFGSPRVPIADQGDNLNFYQSFRNEPVPPDPVIISAVKFTPAVPLSWVASKTATMEAGPSTNSGSLIRRAELSRTTNSIPTLPFAQIFSESPKNMEDMGKAKPPEQTGRDISPNLVAKGPGWKSRNTPEQVNHKLRRSSAWKSRDGKRPVDEVRHTPEISIAKGSVAKGYTPEKSVAKGSVEKSHTSEKSVTKGFGEKSYIPEKSVIKGSVEKGHTPGKSTIKGSAEKGHIPENSATKGPVEKSPNIAEKAFQVPEPKARDIIIKPVDEGYVDKSHTSEKSVTKGSVEKRYIPENSVIKGSAESEFRRSSAWKSRDGKRPVDEVRHTPEISIAKGSVAKGYTPEKSVAKGSVEKSHTSEKSVIKESVEKSYTPGNTVIKGSVEKGHTPENSVTKEPVEKSPNNADKAFQVPEPKGRDIAIKSVGEVTADATEQDQDRIKSTGSEVEWFVKQEMLKSDKDPCMEILSPTKVFVGCYKFENLSVSVNDNSKGLNQLAKKEVKTEQVQTVDGTSDVKEEDFSVSRPLLFVDSAVLLMDVKIVSVSNLNEAVIRCVDPELHDELENLESKIHDDLGNEKGQLLPSATGLCRLQVYNYYVVKLPGSTKCFRVQVLHLFGHRKNSKALVFLIDYGIEEIVLQSYIFFMKPEWKSLPQLSCHGQIQGWIGGPVDGQLDESFKIGEEYETKTVCVQPLATEFLMQKSSQVVEAVGVPFEVRAVRLRIFDEIEAIKHLGISW